MRWLLFCIVAVWVTAVSVRLGLDEFALQQGYTRHCTSYGLELFSNKLSFSIAPGWTLLAIDGKPFTGAHSLFRGVRERASFVIAEVPKPTSIIRGQCRSPFSPEIGLAMEAFRILWPSVALIVLAFQRRDPKRWYFLALTLSLQSFFPWQVLMDLSSLTVLPGLIVDVRDWDDGMRIPALIQQAFFGWSWPAWVVLFLSSGRRYARIAAAPFLAYALLKTVLAVAWSESYLPFVDLYRFVQDYESLTFAVGLTVVSLFFLALDLRAGGTVALTSVLAMAALLSSPPGLSYDANRQLQIPWIWQTPSHIVPFVLLGVWIVCRQARLVSLELWLGVLPLILVATAMSADWIWASRTSHWAVYGTLYYDKVAPWFLCASLVALFFAAPRKKFDILMAGHHPHAAT